ncbi:MAG: type II toxin-antitoxin system HicB family antitoxin [Clostridia bacterium]|nr:type II toxin-antitoxin system HicB family antitoxin [Clostridia bacterium]
MSSLEEYLSLHYPVQITEDPDEGCFIVSCPDLPGCLTSGETLDEAITNAIAARCRWLAAAYSQGIPIREPGTAQPDVACLTLSISRSLHRLLSKRARTAGMTISQYCVDLLSRASTVPAEG